MANVKITALPETTSLKSSDLFTAVVDSTNYKVTVSTLAKSITTVSQSISASYSTNSSLAATASFVTASRVFGPFGSNSVISSSYALTASYALNGGGGGGGGANPGGSDTQIQYRVNGTTFGGVATAVYDGTTLRSTGSFSGSLTGALIGSASYALSSSYSLSSSFVLSSSYSLSSSFVVSSSYSQTASYLNNLVQNLAVTGTLVVSGANGAGVFSHGATLVDYLEGISSTGSYMVWRAPFSCSVVAMYGYREGGSTATVNALKTGSEGSQLLSASNLSLTSNTTWTPFNSVQNQNFNAGDALKIIMTGSSNNQLAVQVDFIRKF